MPAPDATAPADLDAHVCLGDFERTARERLTPQAYDYYVGGAGDEVTVRENRDAWARVALLPRVLVDVSARDLATTVLGRRVAFPVLLAPAAYQQLAHPDGECATARAAHALGTVMTLSTLSNASLEEVRAASAGPLWFQLYCYKDRGHTRDLVQRAEAAGYEAIVLTVDTPLLGRRERDVRNRFRLPNGMRIGNVRPGGVDTLPDVPDSGLAHYFAELLSPAITWDDVRWLRATTRLPVVLKGVVRADDARRAADAGAAAVVVSNHGGRQLDGAVATARALPAVAEAAAASATPLEVLVDGGVRRGADVVRALALGARAVMIGRPLLWGLAAAGEAGVRRVLELLRDETDLAMALCGCRNTAEVTPDLLAPDE